MREFIKLGSAFKVEKRMEANDVQGWNIEVSTIHLIHLLGDVVTVDERRPATHPQNLRDAAR